jgi:hypothetical protein
MQGTLDELGAVLSPHHDFAVPFTRKADLIQTACCYLSSASRVNATQTDVQAFQQKLEGLLAQVQLQGTSTALRRVLTRCYVLLLTQGNSSRVNELCSDNLRVAGNSKLHLSVRL